MLRDDDHIRKAVDLAREAYHVALRRFDQTPTDECGRDAAWATVRETMKGYQTAMDARIASLAQR